ncbi:MAG: PLP-dependent aminotransferase family protein [Gammaproteobacteria bacterium]|nr:PLP-dependent aminotransferase family protein [Gammaproteobacteria bacterium]
MVFADRLTFIESSAIRDLFKLLKSPDIISFAGGFPDIEVFDVDGIKQACDKALNLSAAHALQYGATEGFMPLREEIVKIMSEKGVSDLLPENLIITTGSQQAIDLVGKVLLNPVDNILLEGPTFIAAIQSLKMYGGQIHTINIDDQGLDLGHLEILLETLNPKLMYVIPTFSNPSGVTTSLERRKKLLQLAVKYRCFLLEDDPYSGLYFGTPPPPSLLALSASVEGSRDWVAYCGSLSKIVSPGLRIGWLIAPPTILEKAALCKQFSDAHASTLAQTVAYHYLQSNRLNHAVINMRRVYAERAQLMQGLLNVWMGEKIQFFIPQGGMFIWGQLVKTLPKQDTSAWSKQAVKDLVAFVPGAPFYAENPDRSTFRLSFASTSVDKIELGMERLSRSLDTWLAS